MRIIVLAFLAASVLAQSPQDPNRRPATEDPSANSSTPKSYQGCLVRSGGRMMLTDAENRDYILVSSGRELDEYVGQEVQLSAMTLNPNDPTSDEHGMSAQQKHGQPMTLDVENIRKVADKCSSPKSTDKK